MEWNNLLVDIHNNALEVESMCDLTQEEKTHEWTLA